MRAASASLVVAVALGVGLSATAAAKPCTWTDPGIPPLREWHGYVVLQRTYTCPADAAGELRIEFTATTGKKRIEVGQHKETIKAKGKWPRPLRLLEKVAANKYCTAETGPAAPRRIVGYGSDQELVHDVRVRAEVTATGDLQALKWSGEVAAACRSCPRSSGSIALREGRAMASRVTGETRIVASAEAAWFECATGGKGGTGIATDLAMRFFADRGAEKAVNAIRPVFIVEQLEVRFARQGDRYGFDTPVPLAKLCSAVGPGKHRLMWEVFGRGELMRIGGGGRSWVDVNCP